MRCHNCSGNCTVSAYTQKKPHLINKMLSHTGILDSSLYVRPCVYAYMCACACVYIDHHKSRRYVVAVSVASLSPVVTAWTRLTGFPAARAECRVWSLGIRTGASSPRRPLRAGTVRASSLGFEEEIRKQWGFPVCRVCARAHVNVNRERDVCLAKLYAGTVGNLYPLPIGSGQSL